MHYRGTIAVKNLKRPKKPLRSGAFPYIVGQLAEIAKKGTR